MTTTYELSDYNHLAYDFAVRNPRVIYLLSQDLTDEVVSELLEYGIDATSFYMDDGDVVKINSLQELYLDYPHLKHLDHLAYDPRNGSDNKLNKSFKGNKLLKHPLAGKSFTLSETIEKAMQRIPDYIETRGKKLTRLINGKTFLHYDQNKFEGKSVYAMDPSTNSAKTIRSDIEYISEMLHPEAYLQLLPRIKLLY